jgi:hypothetical protein
MVYGKINSWIVGVGEGVNETVGNGDGVRDSIRVLVVGVTEGREAEDDWHAVITIKMNRQVHCFICQLYQEVMGGKLNHSWNPVRYNS